jgi:methylmalonyl-CoA/ethylmalonyl-CoA epimerase
MKKKISAIAFTFLLSMGAMIMSSSISPATAQDSPAGFEITHHHVALSVPNAEESAAWYKKMFGFEIVTRMNQGVSNKKMFIVHIKRGNCYIELFQIDGAKPLPEYRRDPNDDLGVNGTVHFAFQVADVPAAVKELKAKGAEIAMGPIDTPGVAFVFIRDNAGITFELIQYKK